MRYISQLPSLRHLKPMGCHILSSEVFGNPADDVSGLGSWPSLETFELHISLVTPNGRWNFDGNPEDVWESEERVDNQTDEEFGDFDSAGSDTSDWVPELVWEREGGMAPSCEFRSTPGPKTLTPFLVSMAKAVTRMPALRRLELETCRDSGIAHLSSCHYGLGITDNRFYDESEESFHLARRREPR